MNERKITTGFHHLSVADPGFPRGGAPTPRGGPTYDFAKFSQKLHEIERIWTPRGEGRMSLAHPLRSATVYALKYLSWGNYYP